MNKLEKVIYYCLQQLKHGSIYVWGGQGQKVSKLSLTDLARMETSPDNAARVAAHVFKTLNKIDSKAKVFDCSGLIIMALIYAKVLTKGFDTNAQGLYNMFDKVSISNRTKGDLIYRIEHGKPVHVGIVIDYQHVIECKGRDYGVVESVIDNTWNACNRPEYC